MRKVAFLFGLLGFVLNPMFACSPDDGFTYGEKEMLATVKGSWRVTIDKGNGPVSFALTVDQSSAASARLEKSGYSLVRSAHACGSRTFVKGAAACEDLSQVPLTITFTSGDTAYDALAYTGTFSVYSLNFTQGHLELRFGADWVNANLDRNGTTATVYSSTFKTDQGAPATITIDKLAI